MSAADEQLQSQLGTTGFRYIDDIEFAFGSAAAAETALGPLQETLAQFELALNPTKTHIEKLPALSEEPWISPLRDFRIREKDSQQQSDLIKYFDVAFTLAHAHPTKTVLNYAVARLRSVKLNSANVELAQDLILQSLVNEAGVARFAVEMLIRYRSAEVPLDIEKIANAIGTIVEHHAPNLNGSEVAWALWAAIVFRIPIDERTSRLALAMADPIVALLALDAHSRGLTSSQLPAQLAAEIGKESFGSERWLLLYEAVRNGWLLEEDVLQADAFTPFFKSMSEGGISFYDSETELAKVDRPFDELRTLNIPVLGLVFGY